jgi:hypothetical protein
LSVYSASPKLNVVRVFCTGSLASAAQVLGPSRTGTTVQEFVLFEFWHFVQ